MRLKRVISIGLTLFVAGCAAVPTPQSDSAAAWSQYGETRGEQGYLKQSESRLAKLDDLGILTPELYAAYLDGYQAGRGVYCEQDAYILGVKGMPYYGVCDDLNPFFNQDYISGRNSTAGRL
ncbi:DUF2799 domain-containing protein [Vibrio atypicus]|uniref:DUF2799 domain-containing protein n=1 Tax=Vibrio atypicus TaxID=558271 RepID=UPI00135C0E5D|nr:DUF2799 domain-containing protein [Vibrio atypicus]